MTKEDREYYEMLIDLTADPKWQKFKAEIEKEIYQIQANVLDAIKTEQELYYAKGYAAAMATFVNLRETSKKVLEMADEL